MGLGLSIFAVRETKQHVVAEAAKSAALSAEALPSRREVFWRTTIADRNLSSVTQAGFVNNLNDGMVWGLFPLYFAAAGISLRQIGTLVALYPATWGIAQLFTGAWSDRVGRKWLIAAGMWAHASRIATPILTASPFVFHTRPLPPLS